MQTMSRLPVVRRYSLLNRLWLVAFLAGIAATLIDLLIVTIAAPLVYAPADYPSFTWFPILAGCMIGAFGAYGVYSALRRFARRPIRAFYITAALVLVASYGLPILPIVYPLPRFAGVNWGIAVTLMVMHTVTAIVIVTSLVAFTNKQAVRK